MAENFPSSHAQTLELVPETGKKFTLVDVSAMDHYMDLVGQWDEDATALHSSPEQQPELLNDGEGLRYKEISLYHGGPIQGITDFRPAEDDTIGKGFYATSMPDQAFGYAGVRAKHRVKSGDSVSIPEMPTVYEVKAENVSFLDLRQDEQVNPVLDRYADYLEGLFETDHFDSRAPEYMIDMYKNIVRDKIDLIRVSIKEGKLIYLKEVLQQTGSEFTDFVTELGYDGVIGIEGGEGQMTGEHDSWVVMKPEKLQVTRELSFNHPLVHDQDKWNAHLAKMNNLFGETPKPPQ